MQDIEYVNWRSGGGLGLQIMATAVLKALRDQKPNTIIHAMTSYPEAFVNLPFIDRVYPLNVIPHFYEDHRDYSVVDANPYVDLGYRKDRDHLISAWCKMIGIDPPEKLSGEIVLSDEEKTTARQIVMQWKVDRPLVAFQPFGGTSYHKPEQANDMTRPRQHRELKVEAAQIIIDNLVSLGFVVLHIGLPTEPVMRNCLRLSDKEIMNPRYIFALLEYCKHGIFIDSFAQHAWVALGKKDAIVLWGATNSETLGYPVNKNLNLYNHCSLAPCNRPNTFMFDFGGNAQPWRCMHGGKCMKFDPLQVVIEFLKINDEEKLKIFENKLNKKPQ